MLFIILFFIITILMILVIIGANKFKTNQEKTNELEEQAKIVSSLEYNERRKRLFFLTM